MDVEIFKKEFLPCHQQLYRIAYRLLEDESNAEDMVQETYIKLWNKREELESVDNKRSFAFVIIRNLCLDYLRKVKDRLPISNDTPIPETESLSKTIEDRDTVECIKKLIERLPEQQRLVMKFKHWDDYSDEEIEKITGLSAINIRVTLSRARKTIKEQFKQWYNNGK